MKEDKIRTFLNKPVAVGVPHYSESRPFYYYGLVVEVNKTYLTLEMQGRFKQINFTDIVDIRVSDAKR